jgi:hypothetical protein
MQVYLEEKNFVFRMDEAAGHGILAAGECRCVCLRSEPHEIHQGKYLRFYQYMQMLIWLMNICLALFLVGSCACIQ